MSLVRDHFDQEALRYDSWKERNNYYYTTVKRLYREHIPVDASVLEVGCGTGDILAHIAPRRGVGIDISPGMIAIAQRKHPEFEWHAGTVSSLHDTIHETFDVIFLSDVIEHLEDVEGTFQDMRHYAHPGTRLLINMANPLWSPIIFLLEKLHMKMPEGPHHWTSVRALHRILTRAGFVRKKRSAFLLFPTYVPGISQFFGVIEKMPLMRSLCLIQFLEYRL